MWWCRITDENIKLLGAYCSPDGLDTLWAAMTFIFLNKDFMDTANVNTMDDVQRDAWKTMTTLAFYQRGDQADPSKEELMKSLGNISTIAYHTKGRR